jgi:hypothetical protein
MLQLNRFKLKALVILVIAPLFGCSQLPDNPTAGNPAPTAQQSAMVSCVESSGTWVYKDGDQGFCSYKTADGPAGS